MGLEMCKRGRLDAGAGDLRDEDGTWRLTCEATDLPDVREALEAAEIPFINAAVTRLATTPAAMDNAETAGAVLCPLAIPEHTTATKAQPIQPH